MNKKQLLVTTETIKRYVDKKTEGLQIIDDNKYFLVKNDTPITFKKSDITSEVDATISITNLTGSYGNLTINENEYTYTLNKIMLGMDKFTFNVNNNPQTVLIVPYKEIRYDDNINGIDYIGGWEIEKDFRHYKGSAHKATGLGVNTVYFSTKFKGTGFELLSKLDSSTTSMHIQVFDTEDQETYTFNCDTSSDKDVYQNPVFRVTDLAYGEYTLKVTINDNENSDRDTYYFDSIQIYGTINDITNSIKLLYYTEEQSLSNNVLRTDILNSPYTPNHDYDPATKKYVDDSNLVKPFPLRGGQTNTVYLNDIKDSGMFLLPNSQSNITFLINETTNDNTVVTWKAIGYGTCPAKVLVNKDVTNGVIIMDKFKLAYTIGPTAEKCTITKSPYYLATDNTMEYTPKTDYHPATKKYVDASIEQIKNSELVMATDKEVNDILVDILGKELVAQDTDVTKMLNEVVGGDYIDNK